MHDKKPLTVHLLLLPKPILSGHFPLSNVGVFHCTSERRHILDLRSRDPETEVAGAAPSGRRWVHHQATALGAASVEMVGPQWGGLVRVGREGGGGG